MTRMTTILATTLALAAGPGLPAAADTALILSNARYDAQPQIRSLRTLARLEDDLADAGFDVIVVRNGSAADLREGLSQLLAADERERVLIVAGGHFLRGAGESWLLGAEARAPDLATVGGVGVPVSLLTEIAASAPGRAVVALATEDATLSVGAGLRTGIGRVEPPQGVTVVAGPPGAVAEFVAGPLLSPGADLPVELADMPGIQATGFLSSAVDYIPARGGPVRPAPPRTIPDEDRALWLAVDDLATPAAYRLYLERFPRGAYADLARARLEAAEPADPRSAAEAAEAALDLSRGERQTLQRYLTILGHDTRGVDGIFGPATRNAIATWQDVRGMEATGFLTGDQVVTLRREGEIREAVIAEERRERERQDRAWWEATGAGRTIEGMRDYLARYPDGIFSERARAAIRDAEGERDEAEADAAWQRTLGVDTVEGYRVFIRTYPRSRFVPAAEARILELQTGVGEEDRQRAEAREAALNLPSVTRLLVEQRLARIGLEPGRVDGSFDAETRRAIRAFQEDRGMAPTGYLDEAMIALLLAGSLGEILR
jgi:peptidoglycan hydrolase-like protein with peptidoglycan-binding domain